MTKKLLISCVFLLFGMYAVAQNRVVTGTVTTKSDGLPLPGASVRIKGTSTGTQTNAAGKFSLTVSGKNVTLVITSIGYKAIEVPAKDPITISLLEDNNQLTEVVVTGAFGTTQTQRSVTNNAQVITSEKVNTIRQTNLNNALAGKVAGIQVRSQSVAALGRETEIRLRGATGFGSGNGALYVVDGTILPNGGDDINNDDIEDITILQGPAATALFGSQGAYGAVVVTLKKGRKADGLGVTLNLGMQIDKVSYLPAYQNEYAGGSNSELTTYTWKTGDPEEWKALSGKSYPDYADDASWGPKMTGQEYIPWYAWYPGSKYSYKTASLTPQPNNAKDFYNTGISFNNSVTINQATDQFNFKFTFGNQDVQGLIPNSKLKKNFLNLSASYDINNHLTVGANINYVNRVLHGLISDDYGNMSTGSTNQWFHRDLDMGIMKELRGLKSPQGEFASWNHDNPNAYDASNPIGFYGANYWYNFYTYFDQTNTINNRDRLYGDVKLTYKINNDLSVSGTYRKNQTTTWGEAKVSTALETGAVQTGVKGGYATSNSYLNRQNVEFLVTYKKTIQDFNINANIGSDSYGATYKDNGANTNGGLTVPDLYSISNSVNAAAITNTRYEEKYNAVFAKASIGYKNYLFIDGTVRKDWFSTFPETDNSVLSKSIGVSFVFSDLLKQFTWLSTGKLRASIGEMPISLGTTTERLGAYRSPGPLYALNQYKWNGGLIMNATDSFVDPNIKGSTLQQQEIGIDLGFFKNRLNVSATYWEGTDKEFPFSLSVNGASGRTSLLTNIGEIKRSGWEFQVGGRPVDLPNFSWNVSVNWAPLVKNDVIDLSDEYGISRTGNIGGVWGSTMPTLIHIEGQRWGQIYGNGIKRINGVPVLNDSGFYVNDPNVDFGSVLPKSTGGIQNTFNVYKSFTVSANIDWQIGGKFVSLSNMWGSYSGITARTAGLNDKGKPLRDPVASGGGVHTVGVNAAGEPVDYYVDAQDYYHNLYNNKTFDEFIYDLTFVKLREISIGYNIPVMKLGLGKTIKNANFSITARNPTLIYSKTKDFDPSEIDALEGETGQLPGTRGFGFNLKIGF